MGSLKFTFKFVIEQLFITFAIRNSVGGCQ